MKHTLLLLLLIATFTYAKVTIVTGHNYVHGAILTDDVVRFVSITDTSTIVYDGPHVTLEIKGTDFYVNPTCDSTVEVRYIMMIIDAYHKQLENNKE